MRELGHAQPSARRRSSKPKPERWEDPIVAEVRAARAELLRKAGGTLEGLVTMLMRSQKKRGRKLVQPPRKHKARSK